MSLKKPALRRKLAEDPMHHSWSTDTLNSLWRYDNRAEGELGLELEMEFTRQVTLNEIDPKWRTVRDGSLRGSAREFIFSSPLNRKEAFEALEYLDNFLGDNLKYVRSDSPRTSTHIHLNCREFTQNQILTLMSLWYIIEESLSLTLPKHRQGNLHALRVVDAERVVTTIAAHIENFAKTPVYRQPLALAFNEGERYAALNLAALPKFGSLEFRIFEGVEKPTEARKYIELLLEMYDLVKEGTFSNPREVIVNFSGGMPSNFVRLNMPLMWGQISNVPDVERVLTRGMRYAQEIAYATPSWKASKPKTKPKKGKKSVYGFEPDIILDDLMEEG